MENLDFTDIEAVKAAIAALEQVTYAEKKRADAEKTRADAEKTRADAEKERADAEKRRADAEIRRADAEKRRADAEKTRADAEKMRVSAEKTCADAEKQRAAAIDNQMAEHRDMMADASLHEYIYYFYAHGFQSFRMRPEGEPNTSTGPTFIPGRNCPRKLLPWDGFPELHQQEFTNLSKAFDNRLILPGLLSPVAMQRMAEVRFGGSQPSTFNSLIIELPVSQIANAWRRIVSEEGEGIQFCPNKAFIKNVSSQLWECDMKLSDGEAPGDGWLDFSRIGADLPDPMTVVSVFPSLDDKPAKHAANSPPDADEAWSIKAQSPERNIKPSATSVRMTNQSPNMKTLLVINHKPAHVFTPELLQSAFENIVDSGSSIFIESSNPVASTSTSSDTEEKKSQDHPAGSKLVAEALVQTYHAMVTLGISYGYISTIQATVLLHINYKEPSELYFRLCIHQEDVSNIPSRTVEETSCVPHSQISSALENGIKNTPYAIMMTMIQLAFDHENISLQQIASIQSSLSRYYGSEKSPSDLSPGCVKGHGNADSDSSSLRNPDPHILPPDERSSGQHEHDPFKKHGAHVDLCHNSGTHRPPRLEYCSQQCLLGLVNGDYLDQSCPNVDLHRKDPAIKTTSTSIQEKHPISLSQLVAIVKAQLNTNLDSDCEVQHTKSGLFSILVKLTAHPYGYTFVGKGVVNFALPFIQHELKVYDRLRPVQGDIVPVCLGHVPMQQRLNVGFWPIRQMLLLSYAGEPVIQMDHDVISNLESKLLTLGVVHDNIWAPNVTHDVKSGRTMVIGFHRSHIMRRSPDSPLVECEDATVQTNQGGDASPEGRSMKRVRLEI
ncbi:protein kinase-like domain [Ceratocystis lukuohia]|uniref:Protein kinase-like domain n=1 Tax=Ceratocystis lukuohia TaxID=2019550 RepID=A0ABR4MLL8_9PEZI